MNPEPDRQIISISYEEANSTHVDDMLKRQMSLRGEPGVARDRSRRWYYQNWLVFSLVGMLAAIAAWALIEPSFYDMPYVQGQIESMGTDGSISDSGVTRKQLKFEAAEAGWIKIKGQKMWLLESTRFIAPDGRRRYLNFAELKEGQKVGVYARYIAVGLRDEGVAVAFYVTSTLKPQSAERDGLTLAQVASKSSAVGMLWFPLVAGFIGLAIGAVDGIICRLLRRALLSGLIGLLVGFIGGFVASMLADVVYSFLNSVAETQMTSQGFTTIGVIIQMIGRSLAWGLAGMAMGLGQGISLRSPRLLVYGLLGGVVGGLLGGLLFDPIDFFLLGQHKPSATWSRLVGVAVVGFSVGAMIGVVELLSRDAWLRMTQGPLAGKEFLLFKDTMSVGSSPRSDIYLFNDPLVVADHATLRAIGDDCEIETRHRDNLVLLNNRPVQRARLRHHDQVLIGRTLFVYEKRKG